MSEGYEKHRREIIKILETAYENEGKWKQALKKSKEELKILQDNINLYEKQKETFRKSFFTFGTACSIFKQTVKRIFKMRSNEKDYKKIEPRINAADAYVKSKEELDRLYKRHYVVSSEISRAEEALDKITCQVVALQSMVEASPMPTTMTIKFD